MKHFLFSLKILFYQSSKSGKRSAIIELNNKFYRLKGCGMLEDGFCGTKPNYYGYTQIKGCHYIHTAKRELLITDEMNKIYELEGIKCANISKGFWQYDENFENGGFDHLKNDYKKIPKICAIFETFGDRR